MKLHETPIHVHNLRGCSNMYRHRTDRTRDNDNDRTRSSDGHSVTTFDPTGNAIVVTGPDNAAPVTYGYTERTVMIDELGNPVTVDVVKSGVPVTVFYTQSGSQMIASKVVVRKAAAPVIEEKKTTTTTTATE
jgi:hypothetical protein